MPFTYIRLAKIIPLVGMYIVLIILEASNLAKSNKAENAHTLNNSEIPFLVKILEKLLHICNKGTKYCSQQGCWSPQQDSISRRMEKSWNSHQWHILQVHVNTDKPRNNIDMKRHIAV